jgi:hypothetical protein
MRREQKEQKEKSAQMQNSVNASIRNVAGLNTGETGLDDGNASLIEAHFVAGQDSANGLFGINFASLATETRRSKEGRQARRTSKTEKEETHTPDRTFEFMFEP